MPEPGGEGAAALGPALLSPSQVLELLPWPHFEKCNNTKVDQHQLQELSISQRLLSLENLTYLQQ